MLFLGLNPNKIKGLARFLPLQNSRISRRAMTRSEYRRNEKFRSLASPKI